MRSSLKYFLVGSILLVLMGGGLVSWRNSSLDEALLEVRKMYLDNLVNFAEEAEKLNSIAQERPGSPDFRADLTKQLIQTRNAYKKVEFILEHLYPEHAKYQFNGAPLPKTIVDSLVDKRPEVVEPLGLQILEELIYAEHPDGPKIRELAGILAENASSFVNYQEENIYRLDNRRFFEACRFSILRISFLGLTGFDTPQSGRAIEEAKISWYILREALEAYEDEFEERNEKQGWLLFDRFDKGKAFLTKSQFDTFNHAKWGRNFAQVMYEILFDLQMELNLPTMYEVDPKIDKWEYPVNYRNKFIFEDAFFDKGSFVGHYHKNDEDKRIELGRLLFFDPILSSNNKRACSSCHDPQKAFSDGLPRSLGQNPNALTQRNAMGLINSVFSHGFFYDFRVKNLEDQIDHVVFNPEEFSTDYREIIRKVFSSPTYKFKFSEAFPEMHERQAESGYILKMALASYVASLSSFNSPIDRYMREEGEVNAKVIQGYNLFMGKAGCGTCHFAPSFGGIVPPYYKESESEVLGVPTSVDSAKLDEDMGRHISGWPADQDLWYIHHFKTPSIRNIALTSPYMHNGIYESLEEVMDFYNKGGGTGQGFEVENQTLPGDALGLNEEEMQSIIAFMESLTDTVGLTTVPKELPSFPRGKGWNARKLGGEY